MTGQAPGTSIDICICTFRRAHLKTTLRSLCELRIPRGCSVSVIVADNDTVPSARETVLECAETAPWPLRHVHCPAGNISIARNAALAAATGRYAAFVDDDEIADPGWLVALWEVMSTSAPAVVLGPVVAVYPEAAPSWMAELDLHSTRPVWVKGQIITGYTGNAMLDLLAPSVAGRRFDVGRGTTGGEDTAFFSAVHDAGGVLMYAPDAVLLEPVPAERARFGWLWSRRLRMGVTHGRLLAENRGGGARLSGVVLAFAKASYCLGAAILNLPSALRRNRALLRGALHIGTCLGLLGRAERAQHGLPVVPS